MKSERLRKLEAELTDLDKWLSLGLVPKKDVEKHQNEMILLKDKIEEEKERLRFLRESGAMEDYVPPKRSPHTRQVFSDTNSMPDIDMPDEGGSDLGLDVETESYEFESGSGDETGGGSEAGSLADEEVADDDDEDEDPFSDKNRWKRGVLEDPDSDSW